MAHTINEQVYNVNNQNYSTEQTTELLNFFADKFGWTVSDGKVLSDIDPTFGFYFDEANVLSTSFMQMRSLTGTVILQAKELKKIYYHLSKNEKTIYLRTESTGYTGSGGADTFLCDIIIAYDDENRAALYYTAYNYNDENVRRGSKTLIYTLDHSDNVLTIPNAGRVDTNLDNGLYRMPNYRGHSICSDLYSVISVQLFADISNVCVNINNQVYRIVKCTAALDSSYYVPTFAFPVSD